MLAQDPALEYFCIIRAQTRYLLMRRQIIFIF